MIFKPVLGLGFLVGMQHALEADHIAAVSSIAAHGTRMADIVKHGLTGGLGHTSTLFSFAGAAAIVQGWAVPDTLTQPLEGAVGVMLASLGAHVLWRLWRDRVISTGPAIASGRFRHAATPATGFHMEAWRMSSMGFADARWRWG